MLPLQLLEAVLLWALPQTLPPPLLLAGSPIKVWERSEAPLVPLRPLPPPKVAILLLLLEARLPTLASSPRPAPPTQPPTPPPPHPHPARLHLYRPIPEVSGLLVLIRLPPRLVLQLRKLSMHLLKAPLLVLPERKPARVSCRCYRVSTGVQLLGFLS
ncbi:unnamed protein product [Ectocarpus sp. 6 AP-2014]